MSFARVLVSAARGPVHTAVRELAVNINGRRRLPGAMVRVDTISAPQAIRHQSIKLGAELDLVTGFFKDKKVAVGFAILTTIFALKAYGDEEIKNNCLSKFVDAVMKLNVNNGMTKEDVKDHVQAYLNSYTSMSIAGLAFFLPLKAIQKTPNLLQESFQAWLRSLVTTAPFYGVACGATVPAKGIAAALYPEDSAAPKKAELFVLLGPGSAIEAAGEISAMGVPLNRMLQNPMLLTMAFCGVSARMLYGVVRSLGAHKSEEEKSSFLKELVERSLGTTFGQYLVLCAIQGLNGPRVGVRSALNYARSGHVDPKEGHPFLAVSNLFRTVAMRATYISAWQGVESSFEMDDKSLDKLSKKFIRIAERVGPY